MIRRAMALTGLLFALAAPASAANHFLILSGSGGQEEFDKAFSDRTARLRTALTTKALVESSAITVLEAQSKDRPLTLEVLQKEMDLLSTRLGVGDDLIVILLGHGSQIKNEAKFQIPGPDLEAKAFGEMLKKISAKRIAVINTTASSSGFINGLGGPGRVICTATKSASERNATYFGEYLTVALEEGSADQNRDERISLVEWLQQADTLTHAHYTGENLIASEHALLDDNGDGLGSRVSELAARNEAAPPAPDKPESSPLADGALADQMFIRDFAFPESAPKELVEKYLGLLKKIEELKTKKPDVPAGDYARELEKLLTEAARTHREIRAHDKDAS